jgi:hypothetical protein
MAAGARAFIIVAIVADKALPFEIPWYGCQTFFDSALNTLLRHILVLLFLHFFSICLLLLTINIDGDTAVSLSMIVVILIAINTTC